MNEDLDQRDPPNANAGGAQVVLVDVSMEYTTSAGLVVALDDVSLTVRAGASLAIVGPSGCGKSTLLGIIGGLERPTAGEVRIGDDLVSSMPERERGALRRRGFGFVFQADNLQPFLTVSENVGFQSVLAGLVDDPAKRDALLETLEVGSLGHRFPDQLSGGQRQRAAVARALIHGPQVVLADEPTGSLDPASSDKVVDALLRLHEQQGTTLVVVTHERSVAERMDIMVEMRAGRINGWNEGPS